MTNAQVVIVDYPLLSIGKPYSGIRIVYGTVAIADIQGYPSPARNGKDRQEAAETVVRHAACRANKRTRSS
jgi:hypothetical protein